MDNHARVERNTIVGDEAYIGYNARVGHDTIIGSVARIGHDANIGSEVRVGADVNVGSAHVANGVNINPEDWKRVMGRVTVSWGICDPTVLAVFSNGMMGKPGLLVLYGSHGKRGEVDTIQRYGVE